MPSQIQLQANRQPAIRRRLSKRVPDQYARHDAAAQSLPPNEVFINKYSMVEIKVRGDQTVESVQAMGNDAMRLADQLHKAKKRVMILDNLLEIGDVPIEASTRVAELAKSSNYDKLAMLGSGRLIKIGANLIFHAAGRAKRMRYFDSRTEAIRWLLEE